MSSCLSSSGRFAGKSSFPCLARLVTFLIFCSMERGPSLRGRSDIFSEFEIGTYMKLNAGARLLFASASLPIRSQSSFEVSTLNSESSSLSSAGIFSGFSPPFMKLRSFVTNSSTSNVPVPDFIARAFCAPMFEAINRKWESRVASDGPFTVVPLRITWCGRKPVLKANLSRRACLLFPIVPVAHLRPKLWGFLGILTNDLVWDEFGSSSPINYLLFCSQAFDSLDGASAFVPDPDRDRRRVL
jgi:hypothetical protein